MQVRLKEKPTLDKVDLPASISTSFEKFITTKSQSDLESFLTDFRTLNSLEPEQENYIFTHIASISKSTLPAESPFPESKNDEKLSESIGYPVYAIFKVLHQYEEKCKKCFQNLLKHLKSKMSAIGYLLLYFLKVYMKLQTRKNPSSNHAFKSNVYKIYSDCISENNREKDSVDKILSIDLDLLEKENSQMFLWLLPDIYREFKNSMINNSNIIKILVGCVDAKNLRDLIYSIMQGKLVIFKNDGIIDCIRTSLEYETFEQYFLWQLVQAHDVPIEYIQVYFKYFF